MKSAVLTFRAPAEGGGRKVEAAEAVPTVFHRISDYSSEIAAAIVSAIASTGILKRWFNRKKEDQLASVQRMIELTFAEKEKLLERERQHVDDLRKELELQRTHKHAFRNILFPVLTHYALNLQKMSKTDKEIDLELGEYWARIREIE